MAELNTGGGGHEKGGKKRAKKLSTRVDMTPMVDLAFLLLTFFVLTATFSKPKILTLFVPENRNDPDPSNSTIVKNGITFIVDDKDKLYYYRGALNGTENKLIETNYTKDGLRKLLLTGNNWLIEQLGPLTKERNQLRKGDTNALKQFNEKLNKIKVDTKVLKVIIKNTGGASYKNVIDIVDELGIAQIPVYLISEDKLLETEKSELKKIKEGGN